MQQPQQEASCISSSVVCYKCLTTGYVCGEGRNVDLFASFHHEYNPTVVNFKDISSSMK